MYCNKQYNPFYSKAFELYLKRGTPIKESYYLENNKTPEIYVWRILLGFQKLARR